MRTSGDHRGILRTRATSLGGPNDKDYSNLVCMLIKACGRRILLLLFRGVWTSFEVQAVQDGGVLTKEFAETPQTLFQATRSLKQLFWLSLPYSAPARCRETPVKSKSYMSKISLTSLKGVIWEIM